MLTSQGTLRVSIIRPSPLCSNRMSTPSSSTPQSYLPQWLTVSTCLQLKGSVMTRSGRIYQIVTVIVVFSWNRMRNGWKFSLSLYASNVLGRWEATIATLVTMIFIYETSGICYLQQSWMMDQISNCVGWTPWCTFYAFLWLLALLVCEVKILVLLSLRS